MIAIHINHGVRKNIHNSQNNIIEEIITKSGLFTLNDDETYFSSYIVEEHGSDQPVIPGVPFILKERGKISLDQTKRINKRWKKSKNSTTEPTFNDTNIIEVNDLEIKPKVKRMILTPTFIEYLDKRNRMLDETHGQAGLLSLQIRLRNSKEFTGFFKV